jgi:hypothetical protein
MSREYDNNFDYKEGAHHKSRAVGQLVVGPLQREGVRAKVITMQVNEVDFQNSADAERFIDHQKRKQANRAQLIKGRRLKLASISSD